MLVLGITLYFIIALVIMIVWVRREKTVINEIFDGLLASLITPKAIAKQKLLPSLFWPITAIYQIIYILFWK
jgi:hypothetical protein